MKKANQLLLAIIGILGLLAVLFAIIGVATKNWISVNGNTNELRKKFGQLTNPNGAFIDNLYGALLVPRQYIVIIVNQTLIQVENQLSANLRSTTYSLIDKKVLDTPATKVAEFQSPQGLIITGLLVLIIGTALPAVMMILGLGKNRFLRAIPLFFLVLGSTLILLGYLIFTKIIVEDFGHDLGIKSHLGASFVLVVLSSIIGFIAAVVLGSTMDLYQDHSDSEVKGATMRTGGQGASKHRAPVAKRAHKSRQKFIDEDDNGF